MIVTDRIESFREAARHIWNVHVRHAAQRTQDWDLRDAFSEVYVALFNAMVRYFRVRIVKAEDPAIVDRDALVDVADCRIEYDSPQQEAVPTEYRRHSLDGYHAVRHLCGRCPQPSPRPAPQREREAK